MDRWPTACLLAAVAISGLAILQLPHLSTRFDLIELHAAADPEGRPTTAVVAVALADATPAAVGDEVAAALEAIPGVVGPRSCGSPTRSPMRSETPWRVRCGAATGPDTR